MEILQAWSIGVLPLIKHLDSIKTQQVWYADDSAAGGDLEDLKRWWDELCDLGPRFGYFPKSIKTRLLENPNLLSKAKSLFDSENIKVVTDGVEYLGGAIGSKQYIGSVLSEKIQKWSEKIDILAKIATTEPRRFCGFYCQMAILLSCY